MKYLYLVILVWVFSPNFMYSQKQHSAAEIMKIMENSEIGYLLEILNDKIECEDQKDNVTNIKLARVELGGQIRSVEIILKESSRNFEDRAEFFFSKSNFDSALYYYEKILEENPNASYIMTYVGQIYEIRKMNEEAVKWYKKSIEINYADYMAHWFLADIYALNNRADLALDEILIAHIFNRNNQNLYKSLKYILELHNYKYSDWCFCPQYKLNKINDKEISIISDSNWAAYAMIKAVWNYEPGYSKSMGKYENLPNILEEKEALSGVYNLISKSEIDSISFPDLSCLKKAVEENYLLEYIIYENILSQYPYTSFQFNMNVIDAIKEYLLKIRFAN